MLFNYLGRDFFNSIAAKDQVRCAAPHSAVPVPVPRLCCAGRNAAGQACLITSGGCSAGPLRKPLQLPPPTI